MKQITMEFGIIHQASATDVKVSYWIIEENLIPILILSCLLHFLGKWR